MFAKCLKPLCLWSIATMDNHWHSEAHRTSEQALVDYARLLVERALDDFKF